MEKKFRLLLLLALLLTAATGAWAQEPTTYSVKMKDGTVDAKNWTIASGEKSATGDAADGLTGLSEGDQVTLTYTGRLKVKGVKATSDEKPAGPAPITLAAKLAYTGGEIADFTDATGDLTTLAWAVGEHIAILYEVEGTKKVADAEITAVDGTTGEATIEFTVEDGTPDDTPCTLVYPLSAAKDDHTGVKDAATLLAAQDGTLNANLDVRVGEGTIQTTTPGLTVTTQPAAQFAIFKFTTQDESSTAIDVNSLTVFIGTQKYVITPASATSELYAALPAVSSQAVSFLAAGSDSKNYVFAKDGVTFAASKYYQSPLTMVPGAHLAALTGAYTAQDGETLTGTLAGNYKISIAAGATVTLNGVTIERGFSSSCKWAGITCNGDATITLAAGSTNTVKGFYRNYPGIKAGPSGKTLTIQGTGTLYASVNRSSDCEGAGIGSDATNGGSCGNITILGGTIYATGGSKSYGNTGGPGIGNFAGNSCGNITILGGTINATGGSGSAGIGSGYTGSCGTITIANTVTKVTATKGSGAAIGKGTGSCGVVTIGGTIYWDGSAYQNGGDTYLTTSPFVYEPSN